MRRSGISSARPAIDASVVGFAFRVVVVKKLASGTARSKITKIVVGVGGEQTTVWDPKSGVEAPWKRGTEFVGGSFTGANETLTLTCTGADKLFVAVASTATATGIEAISVLAGSELSTSYTA